MIQKHPRIRGFQEEPCSVPGGADSAPELTRSVLVQAGSVPEEAGFAPKVGWYLLGELYRQYFEKEQ